MVTANHTTIKELMTQFAQFFTHKDADGIGTLLAEEFSLFDPALKWIRGKKTVVDVLKNQFIKTTNVAYEVIKTYEDGNIGIMEFKIILDDLTLYGVDCIECENGKMTELRCYYNSPSLNKTDKLKSLSAQAKSMTKGSVYQHYKGNRYKILSVGRHSETQEECVVYQSLYGDKDVWIRPLSMFMENIVIGGETRPRFTLEKIN